MDREPDFMSSEESADGHAIAVPADPPFVLTSRVSKWPGYVTGWSFSR